MRRIRTLISALLLILGISLGMLSKSGYIDSLDLNISHTLQAWQSAWFIQLNIFISSIEYFTLFLAIAISIFLFKNNKKLESIFILVAGFSWVIPNILKIAFGINCPTPTEVISILPFRSLVNLKSCYPSGHVFDYLSLYGTLYYIRDKISSNIIIQKLIAVASIILVSTIGISRLSLGAHFFSQVVGAYLLGFSWILILIELYKSKIVHLNGSHKI